MSDEAFAENINKAGRDFARRGGGSQDAREFCKKLCRETQDPHFFQYVYSLFMIGFIEEKEIMAKQDPLECSITRVRQLASAVALHNSEEKKVA